MKSKHIYIVIRQLYLSLTKVYNKPQIKLSYDYIIIITSYLHIALSISFHNIQHDIDFGIVY
jgi:hypothetical protein